MNLHTTEKNGITYVKVDRQVLENGLLCKINDGVLHRQNLRLQFIEKADGTVELTLLVSPTSHIPFGYSEEASDNMAVKWNKFIQQLR